MFHSTLTVVPHHLSANPNAIHQSFDLSLGSLLPAKAGSGEYNIFALPKGFITPVNMSSQFVTSSRPPVTMNLDKVLATSCLSAMQSKEIFLLAQEGQRLGMMIAQKFTNLSTQEALFHIGAQSSGYEKVASGIQNISQLTIPSCALENEKG